jgi:phosphoglycerol transferase MdoB-like AlkP superfamily enzyme
MSRSPASPRRWQPQDYAGILTRLAIPVSLLTYTLCSMKYNARWVSLVDNGAFVLVVFWVYDGVVHSPGFSRRFLASLGIVMGLSFAFLFVLLNFRFFHTWGEMDALKQWEDVFAIWAGILHLMTPWDVLIGLLLPLALWMMTLRYPTAVMRPHRRALGLLSILLVVVQAACAGRKSLYSEQNPLFYVFRQKMIQLQLRHGSLLTRRTLEKYWPDSAYFPVDSRVYESARDNDYPLFNRPKADIPPLPMALTSRPNVVLILMESVRAFESGAYGAPVSFTPRLDKIAKEGVLVKNFYANGAQTILGEFALHASFVPNTRGGPVYVDNPELDILTLPMVLQKEGYDTLWIGSHPPTFDNKLKFLSRHGVKEFKTARCEPEEKLGWGAPDTRLFEFAEQTLAARTQPFFAEIMTLSNHFPFGNFPTDARAPEPAGEPHYQRYCRGMYYTDFAVGGFLERVRRQAWAQNTLFIITGDHGIWLFPPEEVLKSVALRQEAFFRVPCLLWSPRLLKPRVLHEPAAHVDVTPTVLDLLNLHPPNSFLGHSLFRDKTPGRFIVMTHDGRWNLRRGNDYAYDVGPESFLSHYPLGNPLDLKQALRRGDLEHLFFRTDRDLLRARGKEYAVPLMDEERKPLEALAEEAVAFFDAAILNDRIYPPENPEAP